MVEKDFYFVEDSDHAMGHAQDLSSREIVK
jgi:hypothetical protein